jgi:hypothetical protein
MKLRTIGKSAAMVGVAVCMTAALSSTNTASAHVIARGGIANKPVKNGSMIYATAQAGCTDYPDTYEARFVLWAWTGSRYVGVPKTYEAAPVPNAVYGIGTPCRHGYIYHSELELWAYHGNELHKISNSATTTKLC